MFPYIYCNSIDIFTPKLKAAFSLVSALHLRGLLYLYDNKNTAELVLHINRYYRQCCAYSTAIFLHTYLCITPAYVQT